MLKGEEVEVEGRVCGGRGLIYTLTEHITDIDNLWRLLVSQLFPSYTLYIRTVKFSFVLNFTTRFLPVKFGVKQLGSR